jgi:hypothetical protein
MDQNEEFDAEESKTKTNIEERREKRKEKKKKNTLATIKKRRL